MILTSRTPPNWRSFLLSHPTQRLSSETSRVPGIVRPGEIFEWPRGRTGRVIAAVGLAIGAFFFVQVAVGPESMWRAYMQACGAAFATLLVAGVAHGLWGGKEIEEAGVPGAGSVKLSDAARAAKRPILVTNRRVSRQMEELSERILAVEEAVENLNRRTKD